MSDKFKKLQVQVFGTGLKHVTNLEKDFVYSATDNNELLDAYQRAAKYIAEKSNTLNTLGTIYYFRIIKVD